MIRSLAWKEYREQRAVWLIMAMLAAAGILARVWLLGAAQGSKAAVVAVRAMALPGTYVAVCGALVLAGEQESGTVGVLDPRRAVR